MTFSQTADAPFLWGVSTSGYQSEGGYNQEGQPQNNWSEAERTGRVSSTHQAAGFWQRYREDFSTCEQMGVNAFRMSLEWPRIQPCYNLSHETVPPIDIEAIHAYAERIADCQRHGLEPVITLQHFTHPAWLGVDAWLKPSTVDAFIEYVTSTVRRVNQQLVNHHNTRPIRWYITINEPNILVINTYLNGSFPSKTGISINKALKAFDHLLAAHIKAYDVIHGLYEAEGWATPKVSLNTYCSDLYWSEKLVWDLFSLAQNPIPQDQLTDYFAERAQVFEVALKHSDLPFRKDLPYRLGRLMRYGIHWLGQRWITLDSFQATLAALKQVPRSQVFDYIAIDYYDPFLAHSVRLPSFTDLAFELSDFRGWVMSSMQTKWWDWRSLPEGLSFFCRYYAQEYASYPLLIAENGMALRRTEDNQTATARTDQLQRSQFIKAHVAEVKTLRDEGIPLVGYMHWSFTDNYEWGSYTPRFGLFSIDFEQGTDRQAVDHLGDRPSQTYAQLIQQDSPIAQ